MLTTIALLACDNATEPTQVETPAVEAQAAQPNVLMFTLDTTRADVLGVYGNTNTTPHIDALAGEGYTFTRAYTVTPLTIPAHSSLFTGLRPPRHGVRDNGDFFLGDDAVTLAEQLKAGGYQTMAAVGAEVTSHHWGFHQGFDAFHDELTDKQQNRWRVERRGDEVIADALKWFEQDASDDPWFSWIHLFDAHHPYEAPEEFAKLFPGKPYLAEVAYVDHLVGQVVDALKARNEFDNTWIVVMADHGESLGAHGEAMHGVLLYDVTTRIPLIIRPPGGVAHTPIHGSVSIVDIMPTVLSVTGAEVPGDLDGVDLSPMFSSPDSDGHDTYLESLYAYRHYGWAPQYALVDRRFKLIASTTPELYRRADKAEAMNLGEDDGITFDDMAQRLDTMRMAMDNAEVVGEAASLSSDRLAQLAALGYITTTASEQMGTPEEGLADPKDRLPFLRELETTRQAMQSGDFAEARRRAEAALKEEPGLADLQLLYANLLMRDGDRDEALALLEPLADSGSAPVLALLGTLRLSGGQPEVGVNRLIQATETDPYFINSWPPLLHALFVSGDIERFQQFAADALERFPDDPAVVGMAGLAQTMANDPNGEALLQTAISANPLLPFLNHGLGLINKRRGDAAQAESLFKEEVANHPPATPSRRALVELYAAQNRYQEQLDELEAIAQVEPPSMMTMHSRAQAMFNLGQYEESQAAVKECRDAAPTYPACAMLEANVLKKLGLEEQAQATFEEAVRLAKEVVPEIEGVQK